MNMSITKTIYSSILMFGALFVSCTKEYDSDCYTGARIRYSYLLNTMDKDLFGSDVNRMGIYIFDNQGLFLDSVIIDNPALLDDQHLVQLSLQPGRYTLLSWGGYIVDHYRIGDMRNPTDPDSFVDGLVKGSTSLDCFRLKLKSIDDNSGNLMAVDDAMDLYYGEATEIEVVSGKLSEQTIPVIKNTNTLKIKVAGLENLNTGLPYSTTTRVDFQPLNITAVEADGSYLWNNGSENYARELIYTPDSYRMADGSVEIDIKVQRLVKDLETIKPFNLKIASAGDGRVIYERNIISEVLSLKDPTGKPIYSSQDDLDREDTYIFDIKISADLVVSVTVNGWVSSSIDKPFGK